MKLDSRISFKEDKPLYLQLSESILDSVRTGELRNGDKVPSINQLSEQNLVSRETAEKAYKQLMKKGIVHSVKGKGYYIKKTDLQSKIRVLVIFNKISDYKRIIFNSLVRTMGSDATIDLSVHHSNAALLDSIITNNIGLYDYYLIACHFYSDQEKAIQAIGKLPSNKVLLLDKQLPEEMEGYTAVYQDYERDIIQGLSEALPHLKKYQRLILCLPAISNMPAEIAKGFKLFSICNSFDHCIIKGLSSNHALKKGDVYIMIEENDLANLIKKCKLNALQVGVDIGLVSYNDTPLKEILLDGITVMSTDHELMGMTAASLLINRSLRTVKNPFSLILRRSL